LLPLVLEKVIPRWLALRVMLGIALALVIAIAVAAMSLIILAIEFTREEE